MSPEEFAQIQREDTEERPLPVLCLYPHPALTTPAEPVQEVTPEIFQLGRDLIRTMVKWGGVGLAAPQVGIPLRVVALATSRQVDGQDRYEPMCLLNPKVLAVAKETDRMEERCLSLPHVVVVVRRPIWVEIESSTPDGNTVSGRFQGPLARIVQHEIDHLDGIMMWDRADRLQRRLLRQAYGRRLKRMRANEGATFS